MDLSLRSRLQTRRVKYLVKHKTKVYRNRLKYLFLHNSPKKQKKLIIVFSGFNGEKPKYNYVKTLLNAKYDKLFILDDFGYTGSYYWYENGCDEPMQLTRGLINDIITQNNYSEIYTAGSSKGGTAAIFYGLEIKASYIFSGACQYYVGKYLSEEKHRKILTGMCGNILSEKDLDAVMENQLKLYCNSKSKIYLLFSKKEHTYSEHIVYLMKDLKNNAIDFTVTEESFQDHSEVGIYFSVLLSDYFIKKFKL